MSYVVIMRQTTTDGTGSKVIENIPQGYYHHLSEANELFMSLVRDHGPYYHIQECFAGDRHEKEIEKIGVLYEKT